MTSLPSYKHRYFSIFMLSAVGFVLGPAIDQARADGWDKKTVLTIDQPIQVRDDLLQPGTYVFKLLDSQSDRHIVQIFNADQTHLIDTILAIPNYRLNPEGRQFAFYETPAGSARAMRAWFYPGDNFGQEFPYPKHLKMIASAVVPMPIQQVDVEPQPEPQPAPVPDAVLTPAPAPAEPEVTTPEPVAEPTPQPAPEPQPATDTTPAELPKTASPFPLIGLSGLLSLGIFGLIRSKRTA